jgi:hypothetical protein
MIMVKKRVFFIPVSLFILVPWTVVDCLFALVIGAQIYTNIASVNLRLANLLAKHVSQTT